MALPEGFDLTRSINMKANLADIWNTDSMNKHLQRDTPIFNCLFGNQQIRAQGNTLATLQNGKNCNEVEIYYLVACGQGVTDCDDACEIPEGPDVCPMTDVIDSFQCKERIIRITELDCPNDISYEEIEAIKMAEAMADLEQFAEENAMGQLVAWSEDLTDVDLPTGGLDAGGTVWQIPPDEWNAQLMVDFQCMIDDCEMTDPKLVVGKAFRKDMMLAEAQSGNGCCNYNALYGTIDTCSNPRLLDKVVGGGSNAAFLVDQAKIGYFNRWIHTSTTPVNMMDAKNTHHWVINSNKLAYRLNGQLIPVMFDVYWQKICVSQDNYEIRIKLSYKWGYTSLPDGCKEDANKIVIQIAQKAAA